MTEVAKIERFPKYRFLSNGSVISLQKSKPLKMSPMRQGKYVGLTLTRADGTQERQYVHRLIAEAFHGPCPDGMVCRHIDGDRKNNSAVNLQWGTQSENNLDKNNHGTAPLGERNPMAKLTALSVAQMRADRKKTNRSYAKIAADYGVSTMTAYRAITGQSWSIS